jgi:hypothetical protein
LGGNERIVRVNGVLVCRGRGIGRGLLSISAGSAGNDETDDVVGMSVQQGAHIAVGDQVVRRGGHLGGIVYGEADAPERAKDQPVRYRQFRIPHTGHAAINARVFP